MVRTIRVAAVAAFAALALSACLRQEATYVLQEDNTVDGNIVFAVHDDYTEGTTSGMDHTQLEADMNNETVAPLNEPPWIGERVTFVGEPISGAYFSNAPVDDWDIKVERIGDQFIVTGAPIDPADEGSKQTVIDEGGAMWVKVTFPGEVLEHNGSLSGKTVTWDMTTQSAAPYARGMAVPPAPEPAPEPEPEPEPVVTVTAEPEPEPEPEPSPSAVPNASPSPSATTEAGDDSSDGGIPIWVWGVGAALIAIIAGLVGFMVASRKPEPVEEEPAPKAKAKPKAKKEAPADDE